MPRWMWMILLAAIALGWCIATAQWQISTPDEQKYEQYKSFDDRR